jgi:primosomal protein N'
MRAIYLQRICSALRRQQIAYYSTPVSAIRQFHGSRLNATASLKKNVDLEVPTPRKRGRPKKIKPEDSTAETVELTTATEAEVEVPPKPAKPRKKAPPKISDLARHIPPTVLQPSPSHSLRPYQEECVEACLKAVEEGKRRLGISLATGAGKTVIFTNLIGKVRLEDSKRYQTLILVHRRELVEQAARHCVEAYPDKVRPLWDLF